MRKLVCPSTIFSSILAGMIFIAILSPLFSMGYAYPDFSRKEKVSCVVCHVNPAGGPVLNHIGDEYMEKKALAPGTKDVEEKLRATYVGGNKCKECHAEQYKFWAETPHSRAFYLLMGKKAENIGECLVCHVTGYNLPGGYQPGGGEKNEALKNVNCENCHGPGSLHVAAPKVEKEKKATINSGVTKKMCLQCHDKENSPDFDFRRYLIHGTHPIKNLILE